MVALYCSSDHSSRRISLSKYFFILKISKTVLISGCQFLFPNSERNFHILLNFIHNSYHIYHEIIFCNVPSKYNTSSSFLLPSMFFCNTNCRFFDSNYCTKNAINQPPIFLVTSSTLFLFLSFLWNV